MTLSAPIEALRKRYRTAIFQVSVSVEVKYSKGRTLRRRSDDFAVDTGNTSRVSELLSDKRKKPRHLKITNTLILRHSTSNFFSNINAEVFEPGASTRGNICPILLSAAAAKTAVSTEPGVGPTSSSSPGGRTSMGLVGYPLYLQDLN